MNNMKNVVLLAVWVFAINVSTVQAGEGAELCAAMKETTGALHDLANMMDYAEYTSTTTSNAIKIADGSAMVLGLLLTTSTAAWEGRQLSKYAVQSDVYQVCMAELGKM